MKKTVRIQVVYEGHVQGVGFRYTVRRLASQIGIKGYVKNLSDGNVMVVAEAEEAMIDSFLDEVKENMSGYIRNALVDWQAASGEFNSFEIRF